MNRPVRAVGIAVAFASVLAVWIAEATTSSILYLWPLFVAAPILAALFGGGRVTAVVAGLALATEPVIFALDERNTAAGCLLPMSMRISVLMIVSTAAALLGRWRERQNAELTQVRQVSDAAQYGILWPPAPHIGPLDVAHAYRAATGKAHIGGDFYAAVRTPAGTQLIIGDVRGKGLGAINQAALIMGAFRAAAPRHVRLPALAAHLDDVLAWHADLDDRDMREDFATAVLIDIPDDRHEAAVVNCGHPPPLLLHHEQTTAWQVPSPTLPLGLGALDRVEVTAQAFPFAPGDMLLLYTDGIIESRDPRGNFYPLTARLHHSSARCCPDHLIAHILDDLTAFSGGIQDDDAALLVARRVQRAAPCTRQPEQPPTKADQRRRDNRSHPKADPAGPKNGKPTCFVAPLSA